MIQVENGSLSVRGRVFTRLIHVTTQDLTLPDSPKAAASFLHVFMPTTSVLCYNIVHIEEKLSLETSVFLHMKTLIPSRT